MSPEQEQNSLGEEQSKEELIPELSSEVLGKVENVDLEKSPDISELGIIDIKTTPVLLPEQKTKSTSSKKEIIAARRAIINTAIQEKAMGAQIVSFINKGGVTGGSGIYSRVTEKFWTAHEGELRNKN